MTNLSGKRLIPLLYLLVLFSGSCGKRKTESPRGIAPRPVIQKDSLNERLRQNSVYIGDSLLKGKRALIERYIDRYRADSCVAHPYRHQELKLEFEGVKNVSDINGDKIPDSVFVLPPFNHCDDGDSYVFVDPNLPRLLTDSYCCHPDNLFAIGDINEDGISEICIFYSSC